MARLWTTQILTMCAAKKAKKAEVLGLWQVGGGLMLDTISAESQLHTALLQP